MPQQNVRPAQRRDPHGSGPADLTIRAGETYALLGPNGAGKSTTIEILEGHRKPDTGEVMVLGTRPWKAAPSFRTRIGIVLVLTTYDDDSDIMRAVESGAVGYLLKDTAGDRIIEAVRAAARGETVLAPPAAARLVSRMRAPELPRLTAREVEVLRCVAQGLSNPEVATALHIAEATVKTHLLRIFNKLDVDDRTPCRGPCHRAGPFVTGLCRNAHCRLQSR